MRLTGLFRQIGLSMSAMIIFAILAIWTGSWIFFAVIYDIDPNLVSQPDDSFPKLAEWLWILFMLVFGLVLAVCFSIRLARRILEPINSVMDNVRRVAHGDLAARATAGDRSLGETAMLVDDFNSMAERLQRTASESRTWNAAIAHELRTPVTILRGTLQGVVDGVFQPEEIEFPALLSQVENLGRLIEDLRTLSLLDSGQLQLRLADADLATQVRQAASLMAPTLAAAGLQLQLSLDGGSVLCDAARLRQVVVALLDNACRYADPGPLKLSLQLDGRQCLLQLEDAGPGIDAALAPLVFDAFRRGEGVRVQAQGGSGLGLAVVAAIARAHGGSASCRRSAAGGTMFSIAWPALAQGAANFQAPRT